VGAVIAGNWKMHLGPGDAAAYFQDLHLQGVPAEREILVFPPAVSVQAVVEAPGRDPRVQVGVQNIHWEDEGAFTGHSERRHVFGETDAEVALKVASARRHGLVPVVCLGETLDERRAGHVDEVILRQLDAALPALGPGGRFLVAYEPVWAIGTGETATPRDASEAHTTLRRRLVESIGHARADAVALLYGGSVKPGNASELLAAPEVDGVLVGGASLDPASFAAIASA
jgi:triosephosphate isomerase